MRGGGNNIGGMNRECTLLDKEDSNTHSSVTILVLGLVGLGWSGALGNLLLNFSTIATDAVTSFRHM